MLLSSTHSVPAVPSFPPTDLTCSKHLISVSSSLHLCTCRFPRQALPASGLAVALTPHRALLLLLPKGQVTIVTLIVRMDWRRKTHEASRGRSRYHSSCPPAAMLRLSSAASLHPPHACSCRAPCTIHSLLTCLAFPSSGGCVLPSVCLTTAAALPCRCLTRTPVTRKVSTPVCTVPRGRHTPSTA